MQIGGHEGRICGGSSCCSGGRSISASQGPAGGGCRTDTPSPAAATVTSCTVLDKIPSLERSLPPSLPPSPTTTYVVPSAFLRLDARSQHEQQTAP